MGQAPPYLLGCNQRGRIVIGRVDVVPYDVIVLSLPCLAFRLSFGGKTDTPAHDLSPAPSTLGLLSLLKEILSSTSVLDEQPQQIEEIISAVIEPLILSLASAASSFSTTGLDIKVALLV